MKKEINFIIQMIQSDFSLDFPYDIAEINWDIVMDLLKQHRIFINAQNVLNNYMPKNYSDKLDKLASDHKKQIDINIARLKEFALAAQKEHVRFVLVKGLGLAEQIYGDFYARQANDLDILVEEDDMIRGHHVLKKIGYKQPNIINFETMDYSELEYPIMRLKHTNHYFEYYTMDKTSWCKIELHKKLYFIEKQFIDDFLWNVSQINVDNVCVNILNLTYSFLMLLANTYENSETLYSIQGKCRIREYIDLHNFIKKYESSLDWEKIRQLILHYGLGTVAAKVIDNLVELYDDNKLLKYKDLMLGNEHIEYDSVWDLNMHFIDKMFDATLRQKKIQILQKEKAFAKSKEKYPIYKQQDLDKMWKLETIHNVQIDYQITYDESKLMLTVRLDRNVATDMENYLFQLIVYNDQLKNPYLYSLLEITFEDDAVAHIINTPILRDSNVLRKKNRGIKKNCVTDKSGDSILLKASITFAEMGLVKDDSNCNFAIAFNWFKYMQPLTYHHMEPSAESLYDSKILKCM